MYEISSVSWQIYINNFYNENKSIDSNIKQITLRSSNFQVNEWKYEIIELWDYKYKEKVADFFKIRRFKYLNHIFLWITIVKLLCNSLVLFNF